MSKKFFKTVLGIAAIAVQFIPGIGQVAGLAISTALSVGASLIKIKPKPPANSPEALNRLRANVDPRAPRKTVVGITAMATDIRDEEFTDGQTYFHRFIVTSSHKVQSHDEVWFDDKLAWSAASGVQAEFAGYLTVASITEGNAGNAINISSRMGSTRRYTGCSYLHLRYKLTGNTSKTDSPFAQSITTRITIRGKAASFYDPRLDSTAGGSGSHRADDQATWAWNDGFCRNPALALLFYLLGYRINGKLAIGKGIPANRIDLESFAVAANICDEEVATPTGTEPRYRCDGVWSEGDNPTAVIDMLKATMNADLDDVGGKLRLTVFHNDLSTPQADFTDDDILDAFEWKPVADLPDSFNVVRGTYTDASDASLYQLVDYPEQRETSPDGIDRIFTLDLPLVQSAYQAQRLAEIRRQRQKYGGVFQAEFQATAWAVQKNSVVRLTFAQTGFTERLFRVAEMEIRQDGKVPMMLREENAAIYGPPTLADPIEAVPTTPYDPTLNPVIGAIGDVSTQITNIGQGAVYGIIDEVTASTSMAPVSGILTVTAKASGEVDLDGSYSFTLASGAGPYRVYAQWHDVTGTPAALGTEQLSGPAYPDNFEQGSGFVSHTVNGLTPGNSYSFRMYARNSGDADPRTLSGTCSAIPT